MLKPLIIRIADSIVFASEAVRRQFGQIPSSIKGGVLYAPVDTRRFSPVIERATLNDLRQELGIPQESRLIGMVGHINEAKGVPDFINAAALIRDLHPESRFIVVGAPLATNKRLFEDVKGLIKSQKLQDQVILTGRRNDVSELLAMFDVFVMPSLYEACPISLLEAMSMAKPIVATDVGGIPQLVRNGVQGLLCPPNNPAALAERILSLLDNPAEGKRLGLEARKRAVTKFDLSICIDLHERYYKELMEQGI
jgi:glycosyltransferase involved in cell wall biosynthesis